VDLLPRFAPAQLSYPSHLGLASLDRGIVTLVPRIYRYEPHRTVESLDTFLHQGYSEELRRMRRLFYQLPRLLCDFAWHVQSHLGLRIICLDLFTIICRYVPWRCLQNLPKTSSSHGNEEQDHSFKHKPFSGPGRIRLILLHPRHSLDPGKCSVIEVSLDGLLFYGAISYT
jgi:hypothetical protein